MEGEAKCDGFCWLVQFVLLTAGFALAQGTTSRVSGIVTDDSGAIIPGATVTLTNEQTGVSFETVTTASGAYAFEAVQVGVYTISIQLQGFKKFVSSGNRVSIGEAATINGKLSTGTLEESIEVRASSQVVQTDTSGNLGTTFDQRTIESLPIVGGRGRNPLDLVLTQPGVVSGANTGGGIHVNGARDRSWNFTLDGIDTNESSAGGSNFSPLRTNPDALAEFKILTGNQTAEFGRNSGGQVAMITRSGTNSFSGTAFYFDRKPEYNANEWENNIDNLPKRNFTQKVPGFSVGGPIRRNQTFFFVNSQWLNVEQTQAITRTVLTQQARQGLFRYVVGARNRPTGVTGASVDANGNVLGGVNIASYNIPANDPQRARARSDRPRDRCADASAEQFHGWRRSQHRRIQLRRTRRRRTDGLRDQDRSHLQQQSRGLRSLLQGLSEHAVRLGQRRRAPLPGRPLHRQHQPVTLQLGRQLALEPDAATWSTSSSSARITSRSISRFQPRTLRCRRTSLPVPRPSASASSRCPRPSMSATSGRSTRSRSSTT